ncbi:TPA: hypothetical protein DIV49_00255 [Candidatus Saccharibacteria bacterium]|nr:hypothetical protein [Candidatus Saccharibacteria bacterium]HRF28055.1 NUDIX hydrolase [Candidatus Saccharibacteria bacterium]HRJ91370.1 NUDIX hydrolase [Candidatus Saccharibacteria bacterium]
MSDHQRSFVRKSFTHPSEYSVPTDAPGLIGDDDTNVVRHNLLETGAPAHTRNYMRGLDSLSWTNTNGQERSQLIIDQKAGSLVLPWEPSQNGGLWVFLQETYRSPHSNDPSLSVKQILARNAFSKLGIWSLEAPAGGIKHDENGEMVETPVAAAVREVSEETGLVFTEESLGNLLPGGLHIGGDINTKVSHLFEADVRKGEFDATRVAIEADEAVRDLLAFHVDDTPDIAELVEHTRRCASTTAALSLAALQPHINRHLR